MEVDGSVGPQVATDVTGEPRWSPDGRWIAFQRGNYRPGETGHDIYVVRANGRGTRRVATDASQGEFGANLDWSPDGTRIVYRGSTRGRQGLFVLRVDETPSSLPVPLVLSPPGVRMSPLFTSASVVDFGTIAATSFNVVNDTTITADSPAGTGVVDVTVGDVDGDGYAEPVFLVNGKIAVYNADAMRTGRVDVMYKTVASQVLLDKDGRVSGIDYVRYDKENGPTTERGRVTGKIYILAGNAIVQSRHEREGSALCQLPCTRRFAANEARMRFFARVRPT
jgi:dipeptidyl aminopeptidase/acylaminoacyl peptidase